MNSRKDSRYRLPARLPTALLWLALIVGTASVGHTQEIQQPSLVITTERPLYTDFSASIRDEMRERTQIAIWMTRINVGTDLNLKLSPPDRRYRMAANDMNKRG